MKSHISAAFNKPTARLWYTMHFWHTSYTALLRTHCALPYRIWVGWACEILLSGLWFACPDCWGHSSFADPIRFYLAMLNALVFGLSTFTANRLSLFRRGTRPWKRLTSFCDEICSDCLPLLLQCRSCPKNGTILNSDEVREYIIHFPDSRSLFRVAH